jgi:hypothetical protein
MTLLPIWDSSLQEALCIRQCLLRLGYKSEEICVEEISGKFRVLLVHVDHVFYFDLRPMQKEEPDLQDRWKQAISEWDGIEPSLLVTKYQTSWASQNQEYMISELQRVGMYPPRKIGLC